jgi:hypothetical protein
MPGVISVQQHREILETAYYLKLPPPKGIVAELSE